MLLEPISCVIAGSVYLIFQVFKAEKHKDLLTKISEEIAQEKVELLTEELKDKKSSLPEVPVPEVRIPPSTQRRVDRGSHDMYERLYSVLDERYDTSTFKAEDEGVKEGQIGIIYEYLKSKNNMSLMYKSQKFKILWHPIIKMVALHEVNMSTNQISKSASLTIRENFSERSFKKSAYEYEVKVYGLFADKKRLFEDFTNHFKTIEDPTYLPRREVRAFQQLYVYHDFIREVKRHYTLDSWSRRYVKITSAETFFQYCNIVGISYSHLDKELLSQELLKLERGDITSF